MLLTVLTQRQMYVANIRTLKLNGAHLLLQGTDDPGSQATHTQTQLPRIMFLVLIIDIVIVRLYRQVCFFSITLSK